MSPRNGSHEALARGGETLTELFSRLVTRFHERPALRFDGETITYGELALRAHRMARYLRARGVRRGDFVGLFMPRGPDMIIAILGILEAGAAYVPMDPLYPIDRVDFICRDAAVKMLVTTSGRVPPSFAHPTLCMDVVGDEIAMANSMAVSCFESGCTGNDLAYLIYTSGSTGRPKGVMIRHSSICHLIRSESSVLGLRLDDVVLQGFSLSFDMSIEEIWTTFHAGALLVVASLETMRSGPDLAPVLAAQGITVWHCVPSLLAVQEHDIPSLRLLNIGGEACPPDLARRWHRKGRRILNTYGPTETTVTATLAELHPDEPVTIGKPLPGYRAFILDDELMPLPDGAEGELHIGGPGLAAGYLNQEELTRERFVQAPFLDDDGTWPRLYRTGDLVRRNERGDIEFHGRRDGQVKIRGFRVELSEIEAVLREEPTVHTATVALLKDPQGFDALVGFVVLRPGVTFEESLTWQRLRAKLPPHMLPVAIEPIAALPELPSGKVDRSKLCFPDKPQRAPRALALPETPMERQIHAVWSEIFAPLPVSIDDDFFLDLGGHSLKVALAVSRLRKTPELSGLSIQDVYRSPTIRALASRFQNAATPAEARPSEPFHEIPRLRYALCVAAQTVGLFFIFGFFSVLWLTPFAVYVLQLSRGFTPISAMLASFGIYLAIIPSYALVAIAVKWLVIGRYKEGDYPLWGSYYLRWWFVRRLLKMVPEGLMLGTPLMPLYLRLLGARVGRDVYVGGGKFDAPDLVSIGDGTSIGVRAVLSCCAIERGLLRVRRVTVGSGCCVGNVATVGLGAQIEDGGELEELSFLSNDAVLPANEVWAGSPARPQGSRVPEADPARCFSPTSTALLLVAALSLPVLGLVPILPSLAWLGQVTNVDGELRFLALTPLLAAMFIVITCLEVALLKWVVLGRVKPERIALSSAKYARYWFVERLMGVTLALVKPLYATLYLMPWYRLLGVKVGKRAEVSTASSIAWDLLELSDECFVADGVTLGAPRVDRGVLDLKSTHVGRRTFLGNNALIPADTFTGDNDLIGCLSVPPRDPAQRRMQAASWFGSPAIFLPQREIVWRFDESVTYRPTPRLYAARLSIELIRVLLPTTCIVALMSLMLFMIAALWQRGFAIWQILLMLPLLNAFVSLLAAAITVGVKYAVIGRYAPIVRPLWSHFVWRSEGVTCLYENLVVPALLEELRGTPYINVVLRWMGCKIGKRVYTDTTDITEHDVVTVGDDASLNEDCGLQTHLFEDRVMKVAHVTIGERCAVGGDAIVLYDSVMEPDSLLSDLSMLMKAETLPRGTDWEGSPAQRIR